ncbi:MAG: hypothetical protein LBS91_06735 [Clostridiales Family XIII bacterium]|jgi:hypothetical protein|nr:hypothetical protein [Clostridiales Family XIII bacterium]
MRDFFYNKSDVLIATVIILVAAFVIYTRVGVIMGYPGLGAKGDGVESVSPPVYAETENGALGTDATDAPVDGGAEAQPVQPSAEPGQQPETAPLGQQPADMGQPPAQPTQSAASVTITVSAGDAASAIADKLLAAGAISDKQAFLSEVMAQGADSKLKMGTFTIPAGSANADIVAILAG